MTNDKNWHQELYPAIRSYSSHLAESTSCCGVTAAIRAKNGLNDK